MQAPAPSGLSLRDLVQPLGTAEFIDRHLLGGTHFLSHPNPVLLDVLTSFPAFQRLESLVTRFNEVTLFGPNGFRSTIPGKTAIDFYHRGDTLYLHSVQRHVPEAVDLFACVAEELGIHRQDLGIEIFAGRQHAISTLHYDHDTNFQILVRGTKRWRVQPNRHIVYPLRPHHDLRSPPEESLAERLPFPRNLADLEDPVELTTQPGTCLFFPIGYWHEVEAFEDCFAINLVLKPSRWVDAITTAARQLLVAQPALRAPAFGAVGQHNGLLKRQALEAFSAGLRAFASVLDRLSPDDVASAKEGGALRWSARCESRRLEETPDGMLLICPDLSPAPFSVERDWQPAMRRLVACRGHFRLGDLKRLAPDTPIATLTALVSYLKALAYVDTTTDREGEAPQGGDVP